MADNSMKVGIKTDGFMGNLFSLKTMKNFASITLFLLKILSQNFQFFVRSIQDNIQTNTFW